MKRNENKKGLLSLEKCEYYLVKIKKIYKPLIKYHKKLNKLIVSQQLESSPNNETLYIFLDLLGDFFIIELHDFVRNLKKYIEDESLNDFKNEINSLSRMSRQLHPLRNVFAHRFNPYLKDKENAKNIPLDDFLSIFKELERINNKIRKEYADSEVIYDNPTNEHDVDYIIKLVTGTNPRLIQSTDNDKTSAQPLNINNMTVTDFLDVCKKEKVDGIDHLRRDLEMITSRTFKQSINRLALLNRIPHLFGFISRIEEIGKYGKIGDIYTRSLIESHKKSEHICYRCAEMIKATD